PLAGLLNSDDPAVHGNGVGPSVVIVTAPAGADTIQSKPLEQVRHTSGWRSGDNVASSGAGSLDSLATRLGCQCERVISQNGLDVVHHTSGQASGQGGALAK